MMFIKHQTRWTKPKEESTPKKNWFLIAVSKVWENADNGGDGAHLVLSQFYPSVVKC